MTNRESTLSRRQFIGAAAASVAAFTIVPRQCVARSGQIPPSEKIRMAAIGVGGQGGSDLKQFRKTNEVELVALCDVDQKRAAPTYELFPDAKRFTDYRQMLDAVEKDIDAVLVATPDHFHAVAAMAAIKRGKHTYCEKPLAHSVYEVRQLMKAAAENKVITQLGNQGHSFDSMRTFREWIVDGAIGNVHTVHVACNAPNSAMGKLAEARISEPVPDTLDWNQWIGPATFRPYNHAYCPASWRSWSPFGTGTLGDWTCHVVDPVFWTLDLGAPDSVIAQAKDYDPVADADTFPRGEVVKYQFAAKGGRGPVTLYWHSGDEAIPHPEGIDPALKLPQVGGLVLGDKGAIMYGSHGAGGVRIVPAEKAHAYQQKLASEPLKKTFPRVKGGHYQNFLDSIRANTPAGSDFSYGGPLTEIALLGNIAIHHLGQELQWDGPAMRFKSSPSATEKLTPRFREGWTL
ncbi:MAG TPA: Gfo/Idh/MocA family oxidoreductase [Tepidisphaeraceae bacterium]|nr:Gfo/Idh/MocA family oxidoreductase [Tepidisphaeraceae bacterium]